MGRGPVIGDGPVNSDITRGKGEDILNPNLDFGFMDSLREVRGPGVADVVPVSENNLLHPARGGERTS